MIFPIIMRSKAIIFLFSALSAMWSSGHAGIIAITETGIGGNAPAIISSNFGEESLSFSDRTHHHNGAAFDPATGSLSTSGSTVIGLPEYLLGGNYIRFANNARDGVLLVIPTVISSNPQSSCLGWSLRCSDVRLMRLVFQFVGCFHWRFEGGARRGVKIQKTN